MTHDLFPPDAVPRRVGGGFVWAEGPVWWPAGGVFVFSDVRANRTHTFDPASGALAVQLDPSGHRNGHALDAQGRLIACSHGERALLRREPDGDWTVLASGFEGRRLNSPNDVALHPDGSLWFSDPDYGLVKPQEGYGGERELPGCWVFRLSPGGDLSAPIRDRDRPNGLAFLDEHTLLLADTGDGATHRYRVTGETAHLEGEHFRVQPGKTDGLRVAEGRIWSSAGDGVHVLSPGGEELARIPVPETVSNLAFGGPQGNLLLITASTGVYLLETHTRGR